MNFPENTHFIATIKNYFSRVFTDDFTDVVHR